MKITEPYKAGFLAFREVDHFQCIIDFARKEYPAEFPQVFMVDGCGIHHPRGMYIFRHIEQYNYLSFHMLLVLSNDVRACNEVVKNDKLHWIRPPSRDPRIA